MGISTPGLIETNEVDGDMRCERCEADTTVHRYDVDGFTGYLCAECQETWDEIQGKTTARPT